MALGTKRKAAQRLSVNPISLPSGAVQEFAGALAPEGWLMCDGAEVSKTTYAALYAVIADTYGTPVDSNNFVLPDLRGEFVRGLDDMGTAQGARGVDSGRALGSAQNQATSAPNTNFTGITGEDGIHDHFIFRDEISTSNLAAGQTNPPATDVDTLGNEDNYNIRRALGGEANAGKVSDAGTHFHSTTITGGGDAETRPRNCAMNFIIKA